MSVWVHLYATIEFRTKQETLPEFALSDDYVSIENYGWNQRAPILIPNEYTLFIDVRYSDDPQIFVPFLFSLVYRLGAKIKAVIKVESGKGFNAFEYNFSLEESV